ncbi:hypothetical protein AAZR23_07890 [Morganella sp. Je.2.23]|uniref:hypothetical protein n=1 Tax=Morganella sp. Je.2.23 TaxID=3142840 RepID=UPI003DA7B29E
MKKVLIAAVCCLMSAGVMAGDKLSNKEIKWLQSTDQAKTLACDKFSNEAYSKLPPKPIIISKSVFDNKSIFDNSVRVCGVAKVDNGKSYSMSIAEEIVIDGVKVSVHHVDGSGRVGNGGYGDSESWGFGCKKEMMHDNVICYISNGDLYIYRDKIGHTIVVGKNHFPNSATLLRVNKDSPVKSGDKGMFDRNLSESLIKKISSIDSISTRYVEWPYERNIDKKINMENYDIAINILEKIFSNHN